MTTKIRANSITAAFLTLIIVTMTAPARAEDLSPEQLRIVEAMPLLNFELKPAPPCEADRIDGRWPYGALLVFKADKLVS